MTSKKTTKATSTDNKTADVSTVSANALGLNRKHDKKSIFQKLVATFEDMDPVELFELTERLYKESRRIKPPKTYTVSDLGVLPPGNWIIPGKLEVDGVWYDLTESDRSLAQEKGVGAMIISKLADYGRLNTKRKLLDLQSKINEIRERLDEYIAATREVLEKEGLGDLLSPDLSIKSAKAGKSRGSHRSIHDYRGKVWEMTKNGVTYTVFLDNDGLITVYDGEDIVVERVSPSSGQAEFREAVGLPEAQVQNAIAFWQAQKHSPSELQDGPPKFAANDK